MVTAESDRRANQKRYANGGMAAAYAAQLERGEQIKDCGSHHAGMRFLLDGSVGDGLTVQESVHQTVLIPTRATVISVPTPYATIAITMS